MSYIISI